MKKVIDETLIISIIASLIPFGVYFYFYRQLPQMIPMHYNANGLVDRFVQKSSWEILVICGLGFLSLIFMKILSACIISDSAKAEKNNVEVTKFIMNISSFLVTILFCAISVYFLIGIIGLQKFNNADVFKMGNAALGFLSIILGVHMPKLKQNKVIGMRTKSTLSYEALWNKTQKFSGKVWAFGGIIILIASIISIFIKGTPVAICLITCPIIFTIIIIISGIYSSYASKR